MLPASMPISVGPKLHSIVPWDLTSTHFLAQVLPGVVSTAYVRVESVRTAIHTLHDALASHVLIHTLREAVTRDESIYTLHDVFQMARAAGRETARAQAAANDCAPTAINLPGPGWEVDVRELFGDIVVSRYGTPSTSQTALMTS